MPAKWKISNQNMIQNGALYMQPCHFLVTTINNIIKVLINCKHSDTRTVMMKIKENTVNDSINREFFMTSISDVVLREEF